MTTLKAIDSPPPSYQTRHMIHATLKKFGYPATLIRDYAHWSVVLRPKQATLGAMVLIAKSDATAFSDLPEGAYQELRTITRHSETTLKSAFSYHKINYLMLMMVDPQVHFHVLPRYETPPLFNDIVCPDPGWPGPPDLSYAADLDDGDFKKLQDRLKKLWPA